MDQAPMRRKIMDSLIEWKNNPNHIGLVITGARQIGKSFIIEQFGREQYEYFAKLDFSDKSNAQSLFKKDIVPERLYQDLKMRIPGFRIEKGKSLLFLDEIQLCDEARSAIKPLVKDGELDIIASGSLLGVNGLKRSEEEGIYWRRRWIKDGPGTYNERPKADSTDPEAATKKYLDDGKKFVSPMGYEHVVKMYPMDFEEYLWALGFSDEQTSSIREHIKNKEPFSESTLEILFRYYRQYTVVGGMPEAILASISTSDSLIDAQTNIINGYSQDVMKYVPDDITPEVRGCLSAIPRNMKKSSMKMMFTDIEGRENVGWREYADPLTWLDASGIVTVCNGLSEPVRPLAFNIGRGFKMYMADTGVLMAMLDDAERTAILDEDRKGINLGSVTENVIANMLERCGIDLYYFERNKTENGKTDRIEVDFVVT